ncbi:MAG: sugar phosphate isomerase/epimerase family protein [Verrucomicrobiota bacterium]
MIPKRREFLKTTLLGGGAASFLVGCSDSEPTATSGEGTPEPSLADRFPISLAQWSLHRALRAGELDNLDFPKFTQETFGIEAVEWVNSFFHVEHPTYGIQPKGQKYLTDMKTRADDSGVVSVLVMCDRVGTLGNPDQLKRTAAIEGHHAWLDAAKFLGCHSIRVNAGSDPALSPEQQADLCTDGLRRLSEHASTLDLNVIVENHGGLSSNGSWLARVIEGVGLENCGTLPDFGNFYVAKNRGKPEQYAKQKAPYEGDPAYTEDETGLGYDRYTGVRELMPFAKGVSAKAHDFDAEGNEVNTDFGRMFDIVEASGYEGYVGIEYEGKTIGEVEGIKKTKALLERVFG